MIRRSTCFAIVTGLIFVVAAQAASRSRYVPGGASRRIVAYFGRTYFPGWLPPRYIYARWTVVEAHGTEGQFLNLYFGKHGRLLKWVVDDPTDAQEYSHTDCSKHPFGRVVKVHGKRIVYNGGAVGQTATLCIAKYRAVTVWNGYSVSRAALERIAASATSVG